MHNRTLAPDREERMRNRAIGVRAKHEGQSATRAQMQRLSDAGDVMNGLYLVAGVGIADIITGSAREKQSSVMLAEALLTSALWTAAIKTVSGRERPREATVLASQYPR
jgi:hypothetical protein